MNVFDLDGSLLGDYERFARSFTQIRSPDIRARVEEIYSSGRFWPEPLISINPHFERGGPITALVTEGSLRSETASVFGVDGQSITLYRHQARSSVLGCSFRATLVCQKEVNSGQRWAVENLDNSELHTHLMLGTTF